MYLLVKLYKKLLPFLVPAIGFSAMSFIVIEIYNRYDGLPAISSSGDSFNSAYLVFAIALMPLNWLIEAVKWRRLIAKFQVMRLSTSYLSIYCGVAASILTPNRIGDYGGRLRFIKPENRLKAIYATFVASFYQTIVTLFVGISGLLFYLNQFSEVQFKTSYFPLVVCFSIAYLFVLLRMKSLIKWLLSFQFTNSYHASFTWFLSLETKELYITFLMATLRYCVFMVQFILVVNFFQLESPLLLLIAAISILYLFTTIIPSGVITDLIIRGAVALVVFGPIIHDEGIILWSVAIIWLLNLALPALIGGLLLLSYRPNRMVK